MQTYCQHLQSLTSDQWRLMGYSVLIPPSVGILAIGRQTIQPIWKNNTFEPQTSIPVSFTFDHRYKR